LKIPAPGSDCQNTGFLPASAIVAVNTGHLATLTTHRRSLRLIQIKGLT